MRDEPYCCPIHGSYLRQSHHCPDCVANARDLVRTLHQHAVAGDLCNFFDLQESLERLFRLLSHGIGLDGKVYQRETRHA